MENLRNGISGSFSSKFKTLSSGILTVFPILCLWSSILCGNALKTQVQAIDEKDIFIAQELLFR